MCVRTLPPAQMKQPTDSASTVVHAMYAMA